MYLLGSLQASKKMPNFQFPDIFKPLSKLLEYNLKASEKTGSISIAYLFYATLIISSGGVIAWKMGSTIAFIGVLVLCIVIVLRAPRITPIQPGQGPAANTTTIPAKSQDNAIQLQENDTEQQTPMDILILNPPLRYADTRKREPLNYKFHSIRTNSKLLTHSNLEPKFFFLCQN